MPPTLQIGDRTLTPRKLMHLEWLRIVRALSRLRPDDDRADAFWAGVVGYTFAGAWPAPRTVDHDVVELGTLVVEHLLPTMALDQVVDLGIEAFRWQRTQRPDLERAVEAAGNSSTPREATSAPSGETST